MLRTLFFSITLLIATIPSPNLVWAQDRPMHPSEDPAALAARQNSATPPDDPQQQAMKDDLQRMRAILNQMKTNLASVGSTTTPLNHQFELEINMWEMLLNQMDRRVQQIPGEKPTR